MSAFLNKVSEYIYNKHGEDIGNICIVLPNRRAKLFIQRYLASFISKAAWSPEIYSIEDFIIKLSGLRIADNIQLLFELFNAHKSINREKPGTFEEFLSWGQILLHDFNDIDLYLVKQDDIFNYLNDAKNIAHWNPDRTTPTENQKKYLQFYSSLLDYYNLFSASLLKSKEVYNGLAYRHVAENIEEIGKSIAWDKIYFAGLNALTISEEKIIRHFINQDKAEILWDADKYIIDDSNQEAGIFLRHYKSAWKLNEYKWIEDSFSEKKNITVTGIPRQIGQVKYAGQLLSELLKEDNESINNTAVVLADENLLLPLLNSMPEGIRQFNVTMGLSLKFIPLNDLFNTLFNLHENAVKLNKKDNDGNYCYYFQDILKFVSHPYINNLSGSGKMVGLTNKLQISKKVFYSQEEIRKLINEYLEASNPISQFLTSSVFQIQNSQVSRFLDCCVELIDILKDYSVRKNTDENRDNNSINIEIEYLYSFARIFKRLKTLLSSEVSASSLQLPASSFSIKALHILFNQVVNSSSLPFYGEPLKGLQIMGLLETRTLDFDNVIMLSVNENLIPSAKTNNSYIPFDIRKKFNLPTYRDRDSIFAYHFYRLLQRAKNVQLIYNTENDDFGKGEKSRFITQIINELPVYNPGITINEQILSIPPSKEDVVKPIVIQKIDDIIDRLVKKAEKGYTPTSLNKYRNCSLQFYFSEVIKLKEKEEVEETIEAATLGTVIHQVLYELYKPYKDKQITKENISGMLENADAIAKQAFKTNYSEGDITSGKNLLIAKVANKFITNFLKSELEFISDKRNKLVIHNLEEFFTGEINLAGFKNLRGLSKVKLTGKIDRADECNGTFRIVDYKTGLVDKSKELTIKEWKDVLDEPKLDKSFQLLIYSWLYRFSKNNSETSSFQLPASSFQSGLISFRQTSKGLQTVTFPDKSETFTDEIFHQIEQVIIQILSNIYDQQKPFIQTDNLETCTYCPYKSICTR
jgi:ATP-dependent helicase/nuclease subunit B